MSFLTVKNKIQKNAWNCRREKVLNPNVLDLDNKVQKCHEPDEGFVLARKCSIRYIDIDLTKILTSKMVLKIELEKLREVTCGQISVSNTHSQHNENNNTSIRQG